MDENITLDLDIVKLLKTEIYDTKPNMSKFLKTYVKSIRILISDGKVDLWPKITYNIGKIIVRFKDDQTLIKDTTTQNFYLYKKFDEQTITNNLKYIEQFFEYLYKFKFVRNGISDVKPFSTDIEKLNSELESQIKCTKEKQVQQFIDYTPKITITDIKY